MDRNLFIAVTLSLLIYVGWFKFIEKRYGPQPGPTYSQDSGSAPGTALQSGDVPGSPPNLSAAQQQGGLQGALDFSMGKLDIKVQPLGASLVSFRYPGPLGQVELIPVPSPGFFATWPGLRFERVADAAGLVFQAKHPSGARIRKEYVIKGFDDLNLIRITLSNPGNKPAQLGDWGLWLGPGLGTVASEEKENPRLWSAIALLPPEQDAARGRLLKVKLKEPQESHQEKWQWLALNNRYFLAAMFPPSGDFARFTTGTVAIAQNPAPWLSVQARSISVPAKGSINLEIPFYFGPKGYTHLGKFGLGLERSVDFGYFSRLGKLTLRILGLFDKAIGNWGWSIILLTVILQFMLAPMTYKGLKAAAKMKKIQPEIAKLQQKFSKDPQRLNAETMQLYKKHGANPLGGCLPMLVQLPVFYALYTALRNAWELHGAPWTLWIRDLSTYDPYYVLPLILGATSFAQNKLNPSPVADPAQAQMMTYIPLIYTFMFLKFPSGLVLYWLTNSLLNFGLQMWMKDRLS